MAFQDKFRAVQFGIPLGVPACELGGEKVLLLHGAPLELSDALPRWLMLHDELVHNDSPACALRFDELGRVAVTWPVWGRFLDWMIEQIDAGSEGQGSQGASGEAGGASAFALHDGMAAGMPSVICRRRGAVFRFGARGVSPRDTSLARCHCANGGPVRDGGRAALTWDGWEAFVSWVHDTLSETLHALEIAYDTEHEHERPQRGDPVS